MVTLMGGKKKRRSPDLKKGSLGENLIIKMINSSGERYNSYSLRRKKRFKMERGNSFSYSFSHRGRVLLPSSR